MHISTKLNKISNFIIEHIKLFNSFDHIYLFGSILDPSKNSNDIDILLIYSKYSDNLINESNLISSTLEMLTKLPIDLTILSVDEEKNTNFIKKLKLKCLKLK